MSQRKRKLPKPEQSGIKIAEPDEAIIWRDETLKSPFDSDPAIERLGGKATLEQALAYNLIWDELTQKWKKQETASEMKVDNQAMFYVSDPSDLTGQAYEPMRIDKQHRLHVYDPNNVAETRFVKYTYNVAASENIHVEIDLGSNIAYGVSYSINNVVLGSNILELSYKDTNDVLTRILYEASFLLPTFDSINIVPYSKFDLHYQADVGESFTIEIWFILFPCDVSRRTIEHGRSHQKVKPISSYEVINMYLCGLGINHVGIYWQRTAGASFTINIYAKFANDTKVLIHTQVFAITGHVEIAVCSADLISFTAQTDASTSGKYALTIRH